MAAPKPEINPCNRPSASVRRIQSTPIGPTGAAMEKPIMTPLNRVEASTCDVFSFWCFDGGRVFIFSFVRVKSVVRCYG